MLIEVEGDLLEFDKAQYIAHQCNCVSKGAGGIAFYIFEKYPHSDVYTRRTQPSTVGSIEICGGTKEERGVINLFAQYYPGGSSDHSNDTPELRIKWMKQCLAKIYNNRDKIKSIAFPFQMGCGIAGGDWNIYKELIKKLAVYMPNTDVYIVEKKFT